MNDDTETTDTVLRIHASIQLEKYSNDIEPRRVFKLAARWQPELDPPVERGDRDARYLIRNLGEGGDIPIEGLSDALTWLERARAYYETTEPPLEGYRGPWAEAVADLTEAQAWLSRIIDATSVVPTSITIDFAEQTTS